jgi:hypothetical protein
MKIFIMSASNRTGETVMDVVYDTEKYTLTISNILLNFVVQEFLYENIEKVLITEPVMAGIKCASQSTT